MASRYYYTLNHCSIQYFPQIQSQIRTIQCRFNRRLFTNSIQMVVNFRIIESDHYCFKAKIVIQYFGYFLSNLCVIRFRLGSGILLNQGLCLRIAYIMQCLKPLMAIVNSMDELLLMMHFCHILVFFGGFFININQLLEMLFKLLRLGKDNFLKNID